MFKKQGSSLESTIETANGYKTYYRDYDRMGIRQPIFTCLLIISLIFSLLAIILAVGIPFSDDRDSENILIMLRNLTKIVEGHSKQITQLYKEYENLHTLVHNNNLEIEKYHDHDDNNDD